MKRLTILTFALALLAGCTDKKDAMLKRATELCQYIPDHQLLERSRDYMTTDFYTVLDTMFNLPEHEAMDHEWLHYFVTGNGGSIADFTVDSVELKDKTHAVAFLTVRQKWEDGSFSAEEDIEEHRLYMEKVDGEWLISDFDEHKQDCINGIAIWRKEEALRQAISNYLVSEIGEFYLKGELCLPVLQIAYEEDKGDQVRVWGDYWVYWYQVSGDTLKTVSGGNHSGCMTLSQQDGKLSVATFEQTTDGAGFEESARRIFGNHYDVFQNIHSSQNVREAVRREQMMTYIRQNGLDIHYYQDYGWDAVSLADFD